MIEVSVAILAKALQPLFWAVDRAFFGGVGTRLAESLEPKEPLDDRLSKLETARAALADGLSAVTELQEAVQLSKRDYVSARADLEATLASKADAESKLKSIRQIMDQEVTAFRSLAGVPDVRRERVVGFLTGVLASIVAAAICAIAVWGWGLLTG